MDAVGAGVLHADGAGPKIVETPALSGSDDRLLVPAPRTPLALHGLALATYLAVSLVLWAHVWVGGNPAHAITCNCGDTVEQVWWFEWLPWAVAHGHNPLLTNAMWARFGGVNALANTSWLAPAAVLSPITVLFGPVASFNVANLVAPVLSGWPAFVLAGRLTRRLGARLVGGGLYAFSPFVLRNVVLGHLDLTLVAYLPLVLLLGLRLLSRGAHPVRIGLLLGGLTILQLFTGAEVLTIAAITCAVGVVVLVIYRRDLVVAARRQVLVAVSVAAVIAGVVLAYPLWFYFAGPRHVIGPYWPVQSSLPWAILWPGPNVFSTHTSLTAVGYLGAQGPDTDYLGIGLLLAVLASLWWWRRRPSCVVVAWVGVATWVLEFVPAVLWAKLPVVASIEQVRFACPVSLCVGLLFAASIDGWWGAVRARWTAARPVRRRTLAQVGVVLLVGAALAPLLVTYSVPFRVTTATVPAWFSHDASRLSPGTAVLTIPFAYGIASRPMGWQAEGHDDFDLIGGWAFVPGGNGVDDEMVSPLGGAVAALRSLSSDPGDLTSSQQATIRAAVMSWRPVAIVVVPQYARPGSEAAVANLLGLRPTLSGGVWVWDIHRTTALGPLA